MYMSKTYTSSRINFFLEAPPLRIFPLDGQIEGEVVVGTTLLHYYFLSLLTPLVSMLEL